MRDRGIWMLLVLAGMFGVLGCGGAQHTDEAETHPEGDHHAHAEHGQLPPTVASFHDALRPVWHSEPGATRAGLACQNAATLSERATAVVNGPAPDGADPTEWRSDADTLATTATALVTECGTPEHAAAEAKLDALHNAFHALMERLPH